MVTPKDKLIPTSQAFQLLAEMQEKLREGRKEVSWHMSAGMHMDQQTKYVSWRGFPENWKTLELLHMTDLQYGHVACKVDRILEYRDWILEKPNRFMLWGGDMLDAWALWSPGMPWEQMLKPSHQLIRFCQIFAPAAHRILGYVSGNHEARIIKGFGDDMGLLIATLLGIPYSNGKQLVDVHFGDHKPFKISLWHGSGSASTKGAIANVVSRFTMQQDSQLYLVGHLHQPVIIVDWREMRDGKLGMKLERITGAMSSSFMDTWGSYGEVKGFRASDVLMARTVLERTGGWEVTLR